MAGFIYVMSNPAFPNLIKIGKSSKDPTKDRVYELHQTGVPAPFKVEYYALVDNEDALENFLHAKFKENRYSKNREFFEVDAGLAIAEIRRILTQKGHLKYEEIFYKSPQQLAKIEQKLDEQRKAAETQYQQKLASEQQALLRQHELEERRKAAALREKEKKRQENISEWKQFFKDAAIVWGAMGSSVGLLLLNGELMNGFLFLVSGGLFLIGLIKAFRTM